MEESNKNCFEQFSSGVMTDKAIDEFITNSKVIITYLKSTRYCNILLYNIERDLETVEGFKEARRENKSRKENKE